MVKTAEEFSDDYAREAILQFLYENWKKPKGMDSAKQQISDIRKALKERGIPGGQVIRNLQYLIDYKWVKEIIKETQFPQGNRVGHGESKSYMITNQGIDFFEGDNRFAKKDGIIGINIENISGVKIVGNNNIVNSEFVSLFHSLDELKNKISLTNELSEEDKLLHQADVNTIQSQLSKPDPDKNIVSKAWERIKVIGTIASLSSSIITIGTFIATRLQ